MSTLLWLTVPQRAVGGVVQLSVLVVPRLVVPPLDFGRIEDFGLRDWPARLLEMGLELRTRSSGVVRVSDQVPVLVSTPDSDVWRAFFDGDAGRIADRGVRQAPRAPSVRAGYADAVGTLHTHRALARSIARHGITDEVSGELATWADRASSSMPDTGARPSPPDPEFHRTVALLREHPSVMRALGLVFDLTVDAAALDIGTPADRSLAVSSLDSPVPIIAPWTRYVLDGDGLRVADEPGTLHRRGMLDLHTAAAAADLRRQPDGSPPPAPDWVVATMDVEGAVNSLAEAGETSRRAEAPPRPDAGSAGSAIRTPGEPPLLPRARSAGLALIRPGRQADYDALIRRAQERVAHDPAVALTADDLLIGYRVDIRRGGGPWRSLCQRDATYTVRADDRTLVIGSPGLEEGHVKPHSAVRRDDGTLETDEVVLRWDGWSLARPSPMARHVERRRSEALPYDLDWTFGAPRDPSGAPLPDLPALRFAERYRIRVRLADVTGGGVRLDEADTEDAATPSVLYTRHEPVDPPMLDAADPLERGASLDVLVVSTDPDDAHDTVTRRTLIPPMGSFLLAEQHRMFDHGANLALARDSFDLSVRNLPPDLPDPAAEGVFAFAPAEPGALETPWEGESEWPRWPTVGSKAVELVGLADASASIHLDFRDDRLIVALPRAEQVTVELSSTIRDDFLDHFALRDWITGEGAPEAWSDAALRGRHPLLSPVRRLTFVHVVKSPLVAPSWELPDTAVTRLPDSSFITLAPTFEPDRLDTDSTARLEVAAHWIDHSDDGTTRRTIPQLHAQTIPRGAPTIPAFRHEFGDTKHRRVTYRLTAIGRFRHFYPDAEPEERFQLSLEQPQAVNVRSSAQPGPPQVLGTLPAFTWTTSASSDRITRRRQTALRVELARPWFVTGEGERLAVLAGLPHADAHAAATRMARDPVVGSSPVPLFPDAAWFTGGLPTEELPPQRRLGPVALVPFDVHDAGEHWYADVGLTAPDAVAGYAPFVQLVVGRYQRDSLPGLELSGPVTCEALRLLPERTLTIDRTRDHVRVSVLGRGPRVGNRIEAVIDELPTGVAPDRTDLLALAGADPSVPAWRARPETKTTGVLGTPLPPVPLPRSNGHLRLRVREIEGIAPDPLAVGPPELTEQTPFFDVVLLPASWRPG